ncbi:MAG: hypothetical protein QOG20_1240 [Pseudonocardiales bacterium]|jgi:hypothetical protein|nr:hypothetical protein [Pseudonocardiales bacterium]
MGIKTPAPAARAGYAGPARLAHSCLRPVRVRLPGPLVRATTTQSRQLKAAERCRSTVRRPTCAQSRSKLYASSGCRRP